MKRQEVVELLKNEFDFGELRDFILYNEFENNRVGDSQTDITIYENEEYEIVYTIMKDKHIVERVTNGTGEVDILFVVNIDWEVK
jgi:hypothetical protein